MNIAVPTLRTSAKALILRDRSVLLQACLIDGRLVHLLPGGTQEFGESLIDTVHREVLEETGLRVRVDEFLWVREFIARNHLPSEGDSDHVVEVIYRCTPDTDDAELGSGALPDTAQIAVRWVALAELPTITIWPETVQRLLIAWDKGGPAPAAAYLGDCP